MKFDIPINFTVEAQSEQQAEQLLHKQLTKTIQRNGLEELIEFQNFEFIAEKSSCFGCRDDY